MWLGGPLSRQSAGKRQTGKGFQFCSISMQNSTEIQSVCVGSNTSKVSYSTKDSSVGFETPPRVRLIDLLTIAVTSFICSEKL